MKAIMVRKPSMALIILAVLVALLAIPSATVLAAHTVTVTLDPVASNDSGDPVNYTLTVKNDIGSADDIVEVTLDVPPAGSGGSNFNVTVINNPTGWTSTFTTDEATRANAITWTTTTNQIGANSTETFTFTATTPGQITTYNWEVTTKDSLGATVLTVVTTEIEITRPTLLSVGWNDVDGGGIISNDDDLIFTFSEAIDQSTITFGNASTTLPPGGLGTTYGTLAAPDLNWDSTGKVLTLTVDTAVDIVPGETVNPSDAVTDIAGNLDETALQTFSETADVAGDDTNLVDTGVDFTTNGTSTGDLIDNVNDDVSRIVQTTADGSLTTTAVPASWSGDVYIIHIGVTAITEADPPSLTSITYSDVGGDTTFDENDTLAFLFSEAMDETTITNANLATALPLSAGVYGAGATTAWSGGNTLTVTLGTDSTFVSGVTVNPADTVTDLAGNADATGAAVAIVDGIDPTLLTIGFTSNDAPDTGITAGDDVEFNFSEAMDTSTITAANLTTALPLSAGLYGTGATAVWSGSDKVLTVTLGAGMTVVSGATVNPDATVTDLAGNSDATTSAGPAIVDDVKPTLLSVTWTDLNPSGDIDAGDTLAFLFSEPMDEGTISGTGTQLDTDLAPSSGSYGSGPTLDWNSTSTLLTVTLADTPSVVAGATVNPDGAVADVEGNFDDTTTVPAIVQVSLSLSVDNATVVQDDTVLVTVNITDVDQFDAANYSIAFDPNVLSFVTAAVGSVGGTDNIPVVATTVVTGTADDTDPSDLPTGFSDLADVSVVTVVQNVGGTVGVSGSGFLAVLSFTFIGNSGEDTVITLVGVTTNPVLIDTDSDGTGETLVQAVTLSDAAAITISPNLSNTAVSSTLVVGDASGDGEVNPLDITSIELSVAAGLVVHGGTPGVTGEATPGADANEDGSINALDITAVELLA